MPHGPRATRTVATWNVRSFRLRAPEVEDLFKTGKLDVAFIQETYQGRRANGAVEPLAFEGHIQSMPAVKAPGRNRNPSMGIAFLSKKHAFRRVAALQDPGGKWQLLAVEIAGVRLLGGYVKPKTNAATWEQFTQQLRNLKHATRPTVACGDFNAIHTDWSASKRNSLGGVAIKKLTCHGPRNTRRGGGRRYVIRAPTTSVRRHGALLSLPEATCFSAIGEGALAASTVDIFLVAEMYPDCCSEARILQPFRVGGSDHLPVAVTLRLQVPSDPEPREVFLPTPHRLAGPLGEKAVAFYESESPELAAAFRDCGNASHLPSLVARLNTMIQKPWLVKVRDKPARFREGWTRAMDDVAKQRSVAWKRMRARAAQGAPSRPDWREVNKFSTKLKRMRRKREHEQRRELADEFRRAANERSLKDVASVLRKAKRASDTASSQGMSMDRREYTKFFTNVPKPPRQVPLSKFKHPADFEARIAAAIRKAKRGKAPGPDGVPMELFKLAPDLFAHLLFEMFDACARCAYVIEGWDLSILIPLHKKGDTSVTSNYRPLRLILIIRKIFEMALEPAMLREFRDELEQFGFLQRTSAIAPTLIVIAYMRMSSLLFPLDLSKAYDMVNKQLLMAQVTETFSPPLAAAIASLLLPSLVRTVGDESLLTLFIDLGLTQGGPLSPRLYNFCSAILIVMMRAAVALHIAPGAPSPFRMFADDVALQTNRQLIARPACYQLYGPYVPRMCEVGHA